MGAIRSPAMTGHSELTYQLEYPSAEIVWARAVEAFGGIELADRWMDAPLALLEHRTPREYAGSGDRGKQREVLILLARIEYGMLS